MDINSVLHGTENALIIVGRDDLIEFASTYADRVLAGQIKASVKQELEKPLSQREACSLLGISRQTLASWRKRGIISAYRISGRVYYKPFELTKAMQKL